MKIDFKQHIKENYNGLSELIKDKDTLQFYEDLIEQSLIHFHNQAVDVCAESAEVINEGTYSRGGNVIDHFEVDKQSILKNKIQTD